MIAFDTVLLIVGAGLLLLGGVSACALLTRALKVSDRVGDETNVGTLWGLFVLCVPAGLLFIWWVLP